MKNLMRKILDPIRPCQRGLNRAIPYTIYGSGVMRASVAGTRKHAKEQFDAAAKIKPGTVIRD